MLAADNIDKTIRQLKDLGYLVNRLTRNDHGKRQNDWEVILFPSSKHPKRAKSRQLNSNVSV